MGGCLSVSASLLDFCISLWELDDGEILDWIGWVVACLPFSAVRVCCLAPSWSSESTCCLTLVHGGHDGERDKNQDLLFVSFFALFCFTPLFLSKRCGFSQSSGSPLFVKLVTCKSGTFPWITILAKRHPLGMEKTHTRKRYD